MSSENSNISIEFRISPVPDNEIEQIFKLFEDMKFIINKVCLLCKNLEIEFLKTSDPGIIRLKDNSQLRFASYYINTRYDFPHKNSYKELVYLLDSNKHSFCSKDLKTIGKRFCLVFNNILNCHYNTNIQYFLYRLVYNWKEEGSYKREQFKC